MLLTTLDMAGARGLTHTCSLCYKTDTWEANNSFYQDLLQEDHQ